MIAIAAKHYGKEVIVSVTSAPDGVKEVSRSIKITDDLMVFFTGESIDFDQCAKMLLPLSLPDYLESLKKK